MSEDGQRKSVGDLVVGYFRDFKVLKETRAEYWGMQVINFLDCTVYFAVLTITVIFLSDNFGFDDKQAGYVITIFGCTTTICLFFSGMFTDWLGIRRSLFLAMGALFLLRGLIMVLGLYPEFLPETRGTIVTVAFFLMAPFLAMIQTVFQAANKRFTTAKSRGAGFNLWYLFMNIGAAAAGFLIDLIYLVLELPRVHIFSFGVFAAVACAIVTFFFVRREEQLSGPDEEPQEQAEPK